MAKKYDMKKYTQTLKDAIRERTGEECPFWLSPLVQSTAMNMAMLDKLQETLINADLEQLEIGSTGQQKSSAHPLLPAYKEVQRTLSLQLEKLGLTYSATPSKITESTKKGMDEDDPMKVFMDSVKRI